MYIYKEKEITKIELEKIENEILSQVNGVIDKEIYTIDEIDSIVENVSYIQAGRKNLLELLSYTKYLKKQYLVSYHYGVESFSNNKNSVGIIYAILSLLHLKLYEQATFLFNKNQENIISIINSNRFNIDDFIDILIYFSIPMTYIDDISDKLESTKDTIKKYIYILTNIINDRKNIVLKEIDLECDTNKNNLIKDYEKYILDNILNILRELNLHGLEHLYILKLDNLSDINVETMIPCDNLEHHICKALIDIIDLDSSKELYKPINISKYNFEDDFIKIISNSSKSNASMHVLDIGGKYILIDCGADTTSKDIKKINIENFFTENKLDIKKLKYLIITHAHLDHYGSIEVVQPYVDKIYMTKDTYNTIKIVASNIFLDSDKIEIKRENDKFNIDDMKIELFNTNHIKGSVGLLINYKGRRIVHTGDFSFNRQSSTQYINEKNFMKFRDADYLIMECTYGNKDIELPYLYKKKLLHYFTNLSANNKVKVLLLAFAIGRAQECYDLVTNSTINANTIIDGSAIKMSQYYNKVDKKNNKIENIDYKKPLKQKYDENEIIIVNGGSLCEGSKSDQYYELALNDEKIVTVLKCGYMDKDIVERKIRLYDSVKINLIDTSLSSHASYQDLIKLISTVQPKNLVLVHGDGINEYN